MTQKRRIRSIAVIVTLVMVFGFAMPALANQAQLAAPVVDQSSGVGTPAGTSPDSRNISWEPVEGAVSYNLFVFNSLADAEDGEDSAIAYVNIPQSDEAITVDFRTLTFTALVDDASTIFVSDAILNDTTYQRGLHVTTNLLPGAYWVRLQAVAAAEANNSALSELAMNRQHATLDLQPLPITIAMGPTDMRVAMETYLDELGEGLRLVDVRPNIPDPGLYYELWTEGTIRYFWERQVNMQTGVAPSEVNTEFMTDAEILEAFPDKDAFIISL
jgi:hypothetical protein